jgi:hypothetical protein
MTGDRFIDDVLQELNAAMAALKNFPFNHFLYVLLQGRNVAFCFGDLGDFCDSGVVWRRRLHFGRLSAQDFRIPLIELSIFYDSPLRGDLEYDFAGHNILNASLRNLLIQHRLEKL